MYSVGGAEEESMELDEKIGNVEPESIIHS